MHNHPLAKPTIYVNTVLSLRLRRAVLRLIGPKRRLHLRLRVIALLVTLGGAFSVSVRGDDEQSSPGPSAERACFLLLRRSPSVAHMGPALDSQPTMFGPSYHTRRDVSPMVVLHCSWTPDEDEQSLSHALVVTLVEPTLPADTLWR